MPASGGYTPPEFPVGPPPGQWPEGPRRSGIPVGAAVGILAGVLALGLALVFTVGRPASGGTSLVGQPGVTATVRVSGSAQPSGGASGAPGATSGNGAPTDQSTDTSTGGAGGGAVSGSGFYVGECVDTSGSGKDYSVDQASCTSAQYKIIHSFEDESGKVSNDQSQCYSIDGNDDEFENGDAGDGYTLYCMNSLLGNYSPRRAAVNNCLDSKGAYEVDCTSSKAAWIVIGRLNGTTDTKGCSKFGSYDYSYYYTATPTFVLCVNKYTG